MLGLAGCTCALAHRCGAAALKGAAAAALALLRSHCFVLLVAARGALACARRCGAAAQEGKQAAALRGKPAARVWWACCGWAADSQAPRQPGGAWRLLCACPKQHSRRAARPPVQVVLCADGALEQAPNMRHTPRVMRLQTASSLAAADASSLPPAPACRLAAASKLLASCRPVRRQEGPTAPAPAPLDQCGKCGGRCGSAAPVLLPACSTAALPAAVVGTWAGSG